MAIQHSAITDPDIHEPKGVATALADKVYVSDGAGSGSWEYPVTRANTLRKGLILTTDGADSASYDETVWKDKEGSIVARAGVGGPNFITYRGGIEAYAFGAGEKVMLYYHMPHDYAPGTDLFFHVHWSHNGTAISGNMVWTYEATYAKGFGQANFPAGVTGTITYNTTNIATTPQYVHRVDEIQLSAASPSAAQLDTDDLEVDGLIMVQLTATTIPTITGGSPNEPFLMMADLHYQALGVGTKNKAPNFYS